MDCIECKACEKVCPSNIPLVKYFKYEKIIQKKINAEVQKKKFFFSRFQLREERLSKQKKIFYENKNYFSTMKLTKPNIFKKTLKKELMSKELTEKDIRKEILRSSIKRVQYKK